MNDPFRGILMWSLGVLFVYLKLNQSIDWSWWLVTAPFWAGPMLTLIVFLALLVFIRSFK